MAGRVPACGPKRNSSAALRDHPSAGEGPAIHVFERLC
jgi:hypothetical protein